jgi:hypothetical protein
LEEREWIPDIFREVAGEQVIDGEHRVVLDNSLLVDFALHRQPREYYRKFRGKNAWLFNVSDEFYDGGYDRYENFRGVFRNHWTGIFNPRRVVQLPLGYTAGLPSNHGGVEASRRAYLWSYLGEARKSSRPEMTKAFLPLTPHFAHITNRGNTQPVGKEEYYRTIQDSIFVPCPMGNVHLESFRTYESLECGAIPIVERRIGFDYYARLLGENPLPTFSSWNRAARFVAEIRDDPAALKKLQAECVQWWAGKKQRLREQIASFVATAPGDEAGPYYSWHYSVPGWQAVELLRHHNVPAVARRVTRQLHRLLARGKLRD